MLLGYKNLFQHRMFLQIFFETSFTTLFRYLVNISYFFNVSKKTGYFIVTISSNSVGANLMNAAKNL